MASGSSVVGTWDLFIDWGCDGSPVPEGLPLTFKADGTWRYDLGGGRWIQVEGMMFFGFDGTPGLIYTANVTLDAMVGIMGFLFGGPPGFSSGCWWATRQGVAGAKGVRAAKPGHDPLLGPPPRS